MIPVDRGVQRIDTLISEIEDDDSRLVDLKRERNKLLPISCLHSHLLLQIFMFYRDAGPYPMRTSGPNFKPDWLAITQVCSFWRSLALGYTLLWDHPPISLVTPQLTRWMLQCSKNAPLYISLVGSKQHSRGERDLSARRLKLALEHIGHTRNLELEMITNEETTVFASEITVPAPLLEVLSLRSSLMLNIPVNILAHSAPKLSHLSIQYNFKMEWHALSHFPSLRYLNLWCEVTGNILAALSQLPKLVSFTYSCYWRTEIEDDTVVTLPVLSRLDMAGDQSQCSRLLSQLRTPSLRHWSLDLNFTSESAPPPLLFTAAFASAAREHGWRPTRLLIDNVGLSSLGDKDKNYWSNDSSPFSFNLNLENNNLWIRELAKSLDIFDATEHLIIDTEFFPAESDELVEEYMASLFALAPHLQSVTHVTFVPSIREEVVQVLKERVSLPKLHTLVLKLTTGYDREARSLTELLHIRRCNDAGIRTLVLDFTYRNFSAEEMDAIRSSFVESLEKLVDQVIFRPYTGDYGV
jgi:hypothetical protein